MLSLTYIALFYEANLKCILIEVKFADTHNCYCDITVVVGSYQREFPDEYNTPLAFNKYMLVYVQRHFTQVTK